VKKEFDKGTMQGRGKWVPAMPDVQSREKTTTWKMRLPTLKEKGGEKG